MLYRYRIYDDYTILYDETTASYSNGEMFTLELRRRRLKNRCDRAPFIPSGQGGPGVIKFIPSAHVLGFY